MLPNLYRFECFSASPVGSRPMTFHRRFQSSHTRLKPRNFVFCALKQIERRVRARHTRTRREEADARPCDEGGIKRMHAKLFKLVPTAPTCCCCREREYRETFSLRNPLKIHRARLPDRAESADTPVACRAMPLQVVAARAIQTIPSDFAA